MADFSVGPEGMGNDISLPCAVDLSALQYTYVKVVSGLVVGCSADDLPLGVLQNKPVGSASNNDIAQVRCLGFSKLKVGAGGLVANGLIKVGAGGVGLDAAGLDHQEYGGQSVGAAASGDIAITLVRPGHVSQ